MQTLDEDGPKNFLGVDSEFLSGAANRASSVGQQLSAALSAPLYISVVRDVYPGRPPRRKIKTMRSFGQDGPESWAHAERFMGEVKGVLHMLSTFDSAEKLDEHAPYILGCFSQTVGTTNVMELIEERLATLRNQGNQSLDSF